jgi:hypothetical protein
MSAQPEAQRTRVALATGKYKKKGSTYKTPTMTGLRLGPFQSGRLRVADCPRYANANVLRSGHFTGRMGGVVENPCIHITNATNETIIIGLYSTVTEGRTSIATVKDQVQVPPGAGAASPNYYLHTEKMASSDVGKVSQLYLYRPTKENVGLFTKGPMRELIAFFMDPTNTNVMKMMRYPLIEEHDQYTINDDKISSFKTNINPLSCSNTSPILQYKERSPADVAAERARDVAAERARVLRSSKKAGFATLRRFERVYKQPTNRPHFGRLYASNF